jgi:hypothetical protein
MLGMSEIKFRQLANKKQISTRLAPRHIVPVRTKTGENIYEVLPPSEKLEPIAVSPASRVVNGRRWIDYQSLKRLAGVE